MKRFSIGDEFFNIIEVKIRRMRPIVLPKSFQDSTMGPFNTFSMATIALMDKDGCSGEAPIFGSYVNILESCILPILLNSERSSYHSLSNSLYWAIRNEGFRGPASALLGQVDMALHDLAAVRNKVPLHRYLNAERDWVHVYGSGGGTNYSMPELEKEILSFLDQGIRTIKIKVGKNNGRNIKEDIERILFVKKLIGNDVSLAVDANQVWDVATALSFSHEIADLQIAWFEEPVHSAAIHQIRELCSSCRIPVSYGESERSGKVFPTLVNAGVKHFQAIPGYLPNIKEWMEVAKLATQNGLHFTSGGFCHYSCEFVAATELQYHTEYLAPIHSSIEAFLHTKPELSKGKFFLSDTPGFTARIDWERVRDRNYLEFEKVWNKGHYRQYLPAVAL